MASLSSDLLSFEHVPLAADVLIARQRSARRGVVSYRGQSSVAG